MLTSRVRADGMRRRSNKWMLAAITLMYVCAVIGFALDLVAINVRVNATTFGFTGRYDSDSGFLAGATDVAQYSVQGVNVRELTGWIQVMLNA